MDGIKNEHIKGSLWVAAIEEELKKIVWDGMGKYIKGLQVQWTRRNGD